MTKQLRSYVGGDWVAGSGGFRPLHNPTTGALIAEASSDGVDMGAAVRHAREVGLPALQALTFAERGACLAAAAKALHGFRDELLALSTESGGNTRGDAKFDVDGATGTLQFYAKLGEKLGETRCFRDGDALQLARSPRFAGQHLWTSCQGVAVHINAFNFPAWGFAEKAAVAWLAGLPVITKPATSTAVLTARMVEILAEAGSLPAGTLSLISGGAGDLLDHLGYQDVLAFTGGSSTALKLRQHPAVTERGCRLNVEADSLNAAILGPDAEADSATFDLFVGDVARDMTQKAGQKCTAIRRVFVPRETLDDAKQALVEALSAIRVGDPALKEVRMGPLATAGQLEDVQQGVARLKEVATPAYGDGGRGELVGVDGEQGYFMSPVLLVADDPRAATVHDREVFGPVATLLPYGDTKELGELVGLGQGGLVASVYTDKPTVATEVALALAPHSGRVNIGSEKVAEHSLGPGAVLPMLLHGGPGRAGGGEELGGARGMQLYMQRTALQGYKPVLEKLVAELPTIS